MLTLLVAAILYAAAFAGDVCRHRDLGVQSQAIAAERSVPAPARIDIPATTCEVVDGDTLRVTWTYEFSARVLGIDTPELHDPEQHAAGQVAKDAATAWLSKAKGVRVEIVKPDKYGGRYLARIISDAGTLTDYMLGQGLAREYNGEKKPAWTAAELRRVEKWKSQ